jgi:hypothetical protein
MDTHIDAFTAGAVRTIAKKKDKNTCVFIINFTFLIGLVQLISLKSQIKIVQTLALDNSVKITVHSRILLACVLPPILFTLIIVDLNESSYLMLTVIQLESTAESKRETRSKEN